MLKFTTYRWILQQMQKASILPKEVILAIIFIFAIYCCKKQLLFWKKSMVSYYTILFLVNFSK